MNATRPPLVFYVIQTKDFCLRNRFETVVAISQTSADDTFKRKQLRKTRMIMVTSLQTIDNNYNSLMPQPPFIRLLSRTKASTKYLPRLAFTLWL